MATVITRAVKGSALTHTEMDANFNNLNSDKIEVAGTPATGDIATFDVNDDIEGTTTIAELKSTIFDFIYPVGSIYVNATSATNPATLLGYGTWTAFGAGRVPVGIDSGDADFDTVEEIGGAKEHTLTIAEMPSHNHSVTYLTLGTASTLTVQENADNTAGSFSTNNTGGGDAHNNVQPYIVVYMWKRTV